MKIISLRLKGFIGIKDKLGLDEISVDLSGLSGLIALDGDNGMGKTTFLENLQPFRTLPSRGGALQKHVFLPNSEKELVFEYNGNIYKTLIKINPDSDRSEGFIWKNVNTNSEVDGKNKSYDKYISDLLGSKNLFFASLFCAQKSEKLSDFPPSKLKQLFSEFLKLDKLISFETTSKKIVGIVNTILDVTTNNRDKLIAKTANKDTLTEQYDKLVLRKTELESLIFDTATKKESLYKEIENLRQLEKKNEQYITEKQKISDIITSETTVYDEKINELSGVIDSLNKKVQAINIDIEKFNTLLSSKDKIIKAEEEYNELQEKLNQLTSEINIKTDEIQKLDDAINKLVENISRLNIEAVDIGNCDIKSQLEKNIDDNTKKLESIASKINTCNEHNETKLLDLKIKGVEDKLSELAKLDLGCTSETCIYSPKVSGIDEQNKTLKETLNKLKEKKSDKEIEIKELLESYLKDKEKLEADNALKQTELSRQNSIISEQKKDCNEKLQRLILEKESIELNKNVIKKNRLDLSTNISKIKSDIENIKILISKKDELSIADARKKDFESNLEKIKTELSEKLNTTETLKISFEKKLKDYKHKEFELGEKIISSVSEDIEITEIAITNIEQKNKTYENEKIEIDVQILVYKDRLKNIENITSEIKLILKTESDLKNEISEWEYLKNACGAKGLRALEIDSVAPIITGYANELLMKTFGSDYTIKFQTQDENGAEVLDIIVINSAGEEILLSNLSGGQEVWILKALRLAMTLISKEKSQRQYNSMFADEEDGALSSENATNFIHLYRSLMEMANIDTCFYVSHKSEAVALADHTLKFIPGGIVIK